MTTCTTGSKVLFQSTLLCAQSAFQSSMAQKPPLQQAGQKKERLARGSSGRSDSRGIPAHPPGPLDDILGQVNELLTQVNDILGQ